MYKTHPALNRIIDLSLIIPTYWILYALPHSLTIPTTRIPLPFPLPNNTAQATTILLVSITYIVCSLRLRQLPPLYRFALPGILVILSITSYELIYSILYRVTHSLPHDSWHTQQYFLIVCELLFLIALKLLLRNINISTITPNISTFIFILIFSLLTIYQWQRGFYINIPDDIIAIIHKVLPFSIYISLIWRSSL